MKPVLSPNAALVVLTLALLMGIAGVLFGYAFRDLGHFSWSPAFLASWAVNPVILLALVLGFGARIASYAALSYVNVSQLTLVSSLGIVATLVLARIFLGEQLAPREIAGGLLIVTGVTLIGR